MIVQYKVHIVFFTQLVHTTFQAEHICLVAYFLTSQAMFIILKTGFLIFISSNIKILFNLRPIWSSPQITPTIHPQFVSSVKYGILMFMR